MSAENRPNSDPEQSLVVRKPIESSMTTPHSRGLLREVKFSPQLPERLMRLNGVFLRMAPQLHEITISLIPGQTPQLDANAAYLNGYAIEVKSTIDGDASLAITARGRERVQTDWAFGLTELQAFVCDIAQGRDAHLQATPHPEERGVFPLLDISLADVTPEMLRDWLTSRPTRYPDSEEGSDHFPYQRRSFEVHLDEQEHPLFQMTLSEYYKEKVAHSVFRAREFVFEGKAAEVETVMDKIAQYLTPPLTPNPKAQ